MAIVNDDELGNSNHDDDTRPAESNEVLIITKDSQDDKSRSEDDPDWGSV